jgi:hypothetical protein
MNAIHYTIENVTLFYAIIVIYEINDTLCFNYTFNIDLFIKQNQPFCSTTR